jgi:perosamine synthetase
MILDKETPMTPTQKNKLAIHGGTPAVPKNTIQKWPPIDDTDRKMVLDSLAGTDHTFGPNCEALQKEFAAWNGNQYAITTNSGTAALHMAIAACDCGVGDEVIVTAYSWSSSATCIMQHNCIPVFVDIDFDTMLMDVNKIEAVITPRTKAIIAVHLHGLPMEMEPILALAKKYNLKVIEDACQAHGSTYKGRKTGTWGDCAAFSLNQNKCLCSGEGGMFVTNNEEVLKKAQALWSFGEASTPSQKRDYHVYAMGWMYRNNDLTASFGRAQLAKLDGYVQHQLDNARILTQALTGTPGLILPMEPKDCKSNYYNYVLRFDMEYLGHSADARTFRDKINNALQAEGVDCLVWQHFILPEMTVFQAKNAYGHGCPWSCPFYGASVDYSPQQYPMATRHCETHTTILTPLRSPNDAHAVILTAKGIKKVMENINQLH